MQNELFVGIVTLLFMPFLWWSFRNLPQERWQIIAAVPSGKVENGLWKGINFTYYGFFVATAQVFSVTVMMVLAASINISLTITLSLIAILLGVSVPAARLFALIIEKRAHTFTVAGASFTGLALAPLILLLLNGSGLITLPVLPFMAAAATSYAFGEGIGRIACISFGCCYGKPVHTLGGFGKWIFGKYNFVFTGMTKKVAYEGGFEHREVVPIQAITSVICIFTGIVGLYLFLLGFYGSACVLAIGVTQLWRCFSETLRADYRGGKKISAYQIMAIFSVVYVITTTWFIGPHHGTELPQIVRGLRGLANPFSIFFAQGIWLVIFLYFGRSSVTGARISFHVNN